ncbi:MAG: single-stranded DNA-binding protein [Anaerolineaceae bacterium]|jgi:single-strand DNA-binding protein
MFHTIIIVGNLGRDPEMRYIASGQAVTSLSVASNYAYRNSEGQQVKETIWFRVSVWGKQAESVNNFLHKGSKVIIEGRLKPDSSTGGPRIWNRQDGTPAASYEVTASTVRFLSAKGEGASGEEISDAGEADSGEEIPF